MHFLIWLLLVVSIVLLWLFPPSLAVAIPIILLVLLICVLVTRAVVRTSRKSPQTGKEGLIGITARIISIKQLGNAVEYGVQIEGELWNAQSPDRLKIGDMVTITSVKGITLQVQRINSSQAPGSSSP